MSLYELRTYTLHVGKMGDVQTLYSQQGYPALDKGGHSRKLVGYFVSDVGTINQLVHLWKFDDDADRRRHWKAVFSDQDFMAFAIQIRPMILSQDVKLLLKAPWGPHP